MSTQALIFLVYLAFALVFLFGELGFHKFGMRPESTRKLVHLGIGLITLSFPFLFDDHLPVLAICAPFLLMDVLAKEFNFLKSIHSIVRKSYGTLAYPVIVYPLFWGYDFVGTLCCDTPQYALYFVPILIMAFSDPMAAVVGKRYPLYKLQLFETEKSLGGFLAFYLSALVICIVCFALFIETMTIGQMFFVGSMIGIFTGLAEVFTRRGWDNFAIPAVAFVMVYFMLY